jgi:hypothetical protein
MDPSQNNQMAGEPSDSPLNGSNDPFMDDSQRTPTDDDTLAGLETKLNDASLSSPEGLDIAAPPNQSQVTPQVNQTTSVGGPTPNAPSQPTPQSDNLPPASPPAGS